MGSSKGWGLGLGLRGYVGSWLGRDWVGFRGGGEGRDDYIIFWRGIGKVSRGRVRGVRNGLGGWCVEGKGGGGGFGLGSFCVLVKGGFGF